MPRGRPRLSVTPDRYVCSYGSHGHCCPLSTKRSVTLATSSHVVHISYTNAYAHPVSCTIGSAARGTIGSSQGNHRSFGKYGKQQSAGDITKRPGTTTNLDNAEQHGNTIDNGPRIS